MNAMLLPDAYHTVQALYIMPLYGRKRYDYGLAVSASADLPAEPMNKITLDFGSSG